MFNLRPYQSDIIDRTRDALREHRSVLVQAPTGSGKTALAAYMIARSAERGKRAWFICHRDFLLTQTAAALDAVGVSYGYVAAHREVNPYHHIQICSIDTLRRRTHRLAPPDLIIWDECHHVGARTWSIVYDWAGSSCRHVGLTATPARFDGKGLGKNFGAIINGPTVRWLINGDFLSSYRCFAPSTPNLGGVHSRAGDYVTSELAGVMDTGTIAGNIVGQYKARALGKRAIYYAVSIEHSRHLTEAFTAAGIPCVHIDGEASAAERMDAAIAMGDGRIKIISNCEIFGEGFDLSALAPGAVIEAVGLCRPTQSLTLHLQQIGRALRPKPEPAIILDHAGNCMRHGLPDDEREWSLDGIAKVSRQDAAPPPIRVCEKCYGCYGASTRICPYCGRQNALTPREVEEIQADLVEADRELLKAARQREVQRAKSLDDLIAIGIQRGYNKPHGWARHIFEARQKKWQKSSSPMVRDALLTSLTLTD